MTDVFRNYALLICLAIGVAVIPFFVSGSYYQGILIFSALNCLTCTGLCLLSGYAGQISIGHAAFNALGAYGTGICTTMFGLSPFVGMAVSAVISVFVAFVLGGPALRLKGHYLAMATLGFGAIIHTVAVAAVDITGGPQGISGIPSISLLGFELDSDLKQYYLCWAIALLGIFFALNLINSRIGRALKSIQGSEAAASSIGINTSIYKIQIFALSALYASISGSLYAHYMAYIDPEPFDVMHSVLLVTMVAVGGMHQIWGAVIGSVVLSLLPEALSFIGENFSIMGVSYKTDYNTLVYGGILLVIMLFLPDGLAGGLVKIKNSLKSSVIKTRKSA
ncbi:branched-chain amino acid ABC transporter permease [Desulforegula conservatrix]|uniref:branched-chain amino acid ABC transporter permease n=1 Tax=Desulforegula conservatrix TaxID=153026 RepID=UPI0003F5E90E|nr:branched-chain amino acid ABC transporter permease [Desulforegula conservatrix]